MLPLYVMIGFAAFLMSVLAVPVIVSDARRRRAREVEAGYVHQKLVRLSDRVSRPAGDQDDPFRQMILGA